MSDKKEDEKGEPIIEMYRVLSPVVLTTDGQYYKFPDIVDLSHLPDKSIQWFLDHGFYELVEGEPKNVPKPYDGDDEAARKPRPCCK